MTTPLPWWRTDTYDGDQLIPAAFEETAGPNGVGVVRLWGSGKTDPGWGLKRVDTHPGFMENYTRGRFKTGPILMGAAAKKWNFCFIMRSMRLVCIDIDGKNDGYSNVGKLGMLPYTLAETSKSGDGYHLFYATSEDTWSETEGFGLFKDRINLEQGVDFRATGCVYHWRMQRWNSRSIAELPQHLKDRLRKREAQVSAQVDAIIKILDNGDETEVLLMHDSLITDLAKPIPNGRRNNTLFAIGNQMKQAQIPGWEQQVEDRAKQVGLDSDEILKLINNITKYGVAP